MRTINLFDIAMKVFFPKEEVEAPLPLEEAARRVVEQASWADHQFRVGDDSYSEWCVVQKSVISALQTALDKTSEAAAGGVSVATGAHRTETRPSPPTRSSEEVGSPSGEDCANADCGLPAGHGSKHVDAREVSAVYERELIAAWLESKVVGATSWVQNLPKEIRKGQHRKDAAKKSSF